MTEATVQQVEDMLAGNFPSLDLDALGEAPDAYRTSTDATRVGAARADGGRIEP